jgi:hypothetical protein
VLAVGAAPAALAAAPVTPPADTPNLALMVIQPADLVPGAVISAQHYVTPPPRSGLTAQYSSGFSTASTTDGVSYAGLTDTVAIGPSSAAASGLFADEAKLFGSARGRAILRRAFVKSTAKRLHPKASDVTFGAATAAGVGSDSFIETVTYKLHHTTVHQLIVFFDDGALYGGLALTGKNNEQIPQADGVSLAGTIDAHIHAVLGTTGSTGTTGASS